MNIEPKKITFADLTSGSNSSLELKVPDYQRGYIWKTNEQISEFWEDLVDHFDDQVNIKDDAPSNLFLGNIILCDDQIVDGQQRLTTIFIMLVAFRSWVRLKRLSSEDPNAQRRLETVRVKIDAILFHTDDNQDRTGPRLTAAPTINRSLDYISGPDWEHNDFPIADNNKKPLLAQNNRVKPIYQFFYKNIDEIVSVENFPSFFNVINHLTFIEINLKRMQDAFMFFERTNSRGKDLEVGDLLKAHLFGNHPDAETIVSVWQDICDNSNGNLTRMLKYFYITQNNHITSSRLFHGLKEMITNNSEENTDNKVSLFVTQLDEFSKFFNVVNKKNLNDEASLREVFRRIGPHYDDRTGITKDRIERIYHAIDGLNLFGVTQTIPVMWSFIKSFYKLKLYDQSRHDKTLVSFFETLENYHFINNFILSRVGNEVEKFYAEYAEKFHNVQNDYAFTETLQYFYKRLREGSKTTGKKEGGIASKEEFISVFSNLDYQTNRDALYYIFDRFNNVDDKKKKTTESLRTKIYFSKTQKDRKDISIEHWYPKSKAKDDRGDELSWVHNIGNLLVLPQSINNDQRLGSRLPHDKYQQISSNPTLNPSNYRHNIYFIKEYAPFEDWGEDTIKIRAKKLAEEAYDVIWRFSPPLLEPNKKG